jgi:hypothetical protein
VLALLPISLCEPWSCAVRRQFRISTPAVDCTLTSGAKNIRGKDALAFRKKDYCLRRVCRRRLCCECDEPHIYARPRGRKSLCARYSLRRSLQGITSFLPGRLSPPFRPFRDQREGRQCSTGSNISRKENLPEGRDRRFCRRRTLRREKSAVS